MTRVPAVTNNTIFGLITKFATRALPRVDQVVEKGMRLFVTDTGFVGMVHPQGRR